MPNNAPQVGTIEDGYRFRGGDPSKPESWQQVTTEAEGIANRPSQTAPPTAGAHTLARPAMPGVASRYAGPQSVALTPEMRESRDKPREVTTGLAGGSLLAAGAAAPGAIGLAAGLAGRGLTGLQGAAYGSKLSEEAGMGPWPGRIAGGLTGALLPEVIGKFTNPITSRLAGLFGKAAPEVATATEATPDVLHVPTRPGPFPNVPEGNIQNVPRDLLPGIATRTGDPAAAAEFSRVTNRPSLFVPEGESATWRPPGVDVEPGLQGKPTPFGGLPKSEPVMQGGGAFVGPTKTAATTPAWQTGQATELTLKAHSVANDPAASPEELRWAQSILRGER